MRIQLIADNAGGLTLQVATRPRYVHHYYGNYDYAGHLADDLVELVTGSHPRDWEGNEIAELGWMVYDRNIARNGGYTWYEGTPRQVVRAVLDDADSALAEALIRRGAGRKGDRVPQEA
jgi:hypothetical protein